jgi:hypothetical protein
MAERLNAPVLKTGVPQGPRVRIPLFPSGHFFRTLATSICLSSFSFARLVPSLHRLHFHKNLDTIYFKTTLAFLVELVDTLVLGTSAFGMRVRVPRKAFFYFLN